MDKSFIEQQRGRLRALRRQILGPELAELEKERAEKQMHGDEPHELEETAQEMSVTEIHQALHDVDNRRLQSIERALQKIEEGTYGISDVSGKRIPRARLEATPEATLTVEEEAEFEAQRRT